MTADSSPTQSRAPTDMASPACYCRPSIYCTTCAWYDRVYQNVQARRRQAQQREAAWTLTMLLSNSRRPEPRR